MYTIRVVVLRCSRCGAEYEVVNPTGWRGYRCRYCGMDITKSKVKRVLRFPSFEEYEKALLEMRRALK